MPPTRKRGGAIHNSLIVDTPDKLSLMNKLMQKSGPGVVSYVLVYAPWCGACRRFRENVWDPSLNVPTTHNRIAVKDDVFNNSPMAKDVPDLKFLPSMFVVKDGVIQLHKKPGGDTAIIPTPKTKEELLQMANVKLKPEANANNTRANANNTRSNANNTRANAIKDIFVKTESPVSTTIENANKNVIIANNATKEVKKMTVALNNASRNTLQKAIQNVSKAVTNAQAAAAAAKNSANSVKKMVENAKGDLNTKTNANAKAAVAAAAGAAVGAELAAVAATNAVKKNNNGSAVVLPVETMEDEQMPELVGPNTLEPNESLNMLESNDDLNTLEPEPITQLVSNNSIVPNIVIEPMAPEANVNSKNPTPEVAPQRGGRTTRRSKGKLYRMLVALNKKALKRKTRSKKLTRQRR
jgi:hypothetical protein